jgi:hypothetical protein
MEKKLGIPLFHIDKLELSNTLEILTRPGTIQQPKVEEISIQSDTLGRLVLWRL